MLHILQSPLGETPMLHLFQWIALWNLAEFVETTGRTPTATVDSMFQRCIKRGTVDACLSAGNYFQTR